MVENLYWDDPPNPRTGTALLILTTNSFSFFDLRFDFESNCLPNPFSIAAFP